MPKIDIFKTPNPEKQNLLKILWASKRRIWRNVARQLARPRKNQAAVNLGRINRLVKPNETIVVPGKVLALGNLDKKITLAAFTFSEGCKEKVTDSEFISIQELFSRNPEGKNIRIII